jgi:hypothetical protein
MTMSTSFHTRPLAAAERRRAALAALAARSAAARVTR